MGELLKAIIALYQGQSAKAIALRALSVGSMWLSKAPTDISGVYIIIVSLPSPIAYAMGGSYTQDGGIQFSVCTIDGTADSVKLAMESLENLYDFCTFTMTGKRLLVARRVNERGPLKDDTTGGHIGYVEYKFVIGG